MKPFNLAESKIAERKYCRIVITKKIRILMLMVIIVIFAASVSAGSKVLIRGKATELKSELAELQEKNITLKRNLSTLQMSEARKKWQQNLNESSSKLIYLIESISSAVPSDVWLNQINTASKDGQIMIEGFAVSFDSISKFTNNLSNNSEFKEVRLVSTNVLSTNSVGFSISIATKQAAAVQTDQSAEDGNLEGAE